MTRKGVIQADFDYFCRIKTDIYKLIRKNEKQDNNMV